MIPEVIGTTLIKDGAITTDKILANNITTALIQAGAIGTNELSAQAVTSSKLAVTSLGSALNDDPNFID